MPAIKRLPISELSLDLKNFRTVAQDDEALALRAIVAIKPTYFWGLMESILDEGFDPTENIIVLKTGGEHEKLIVKEGNRRIASLKLIHGHLSLPDEGLPAHLRTKIVGLSPGWLSSNERVSCVVYGPSEADTVDALVSRIHGKGEHAGRLKWEPVAKARHNRDQNKQSEPGLDLLEAYLRCGRNLTADQAERWAGDYYLTVLDEFLKRFSSRFGATSGRDLATKYPKVDYRDALEKVLLGIGLEEIGYEEVRDRTEAVLQTRCGLPAALAPPVAMPPGAATSGGATSIPGGPVPATTPDNGLAGRVIHAVSVDDPRSVRRRLKRLHPVGRNREKLTTLLKEASKLDIADTPHAFCFLMRTIISISAWAYCDDHKASGLTTLNSDGSEKELRVVLTEVVEHLRSQLPAKSPKRKELGSALGEVSRKDSFLSIVALNQLVHSPRFSIDASRICTQFQNTFLLVEAMNS